MKKCLAYILLLATVSLALCTACTPSHSADTETESIAETVKDSDTEQEFLTDTESERETDAEKMNIPTNYDEFFDSERKHQPSIEDAQRIKNGMTVKEIFEILGNPHEPGPTSGVISVMWELDNGGKIITSLCVLPDSRPSSEAPESLWEDLYRYGVGFLRPVPEQMKT